MAKMNTEIPLRHGMTIWELRAELNRLPAEGVVSIRTSLGDRPWDSDQNTLVVSWETPTPEQKDN